MALIVDTGPLLSYIDASDRDHQRCVALLDGIDETLVIPAPVLVEVDYWLMKLFGPKIACRFLEDIIEGRFEIEALTAGDYTRVLQLCRRYADAPIGFVDAAVLAVVERRNEPKVATLDRRHFGVVRPRHVDALILLP